MKIGSLVYATDQGLGILAKSFYDAGVVTDVMVVRHGRRHTHDEWYPNSQQITDLKDPTQIRNMKLFCRSVQIMLFFETPFIWGLLPYCKKYRVKTVLMPMYECVPEQLPATPDTFLNPSHLDQQYYPTGIHIPIPVAYPWVKRDRARVFVHNGGHGGLKGRNGTMEFIRAVSLIKSPAKIIFRTQESHRYQHLIHTLRRRGVNIEVVCDTVPYDQLFATGDVFVFPEKFNGLSLPLQEARAAGMLIMCGDRPPMNQWLPNRFHDIPGGCFNDESMREMRTLIPIAGYKKNRIGPPFNEFDEAIFDPKDIAAKIDEWYDRDISEYSESGRTWAEQMSWAALKPRYEEFFRCLI